MHRFWLAFLVPEHVRAALGIAHRFFYPIALRHAFALALRLGNVDALPHSLSISIVLALAASLALAPRKRLRLSHALAERHSNRL